MKEFATDRTQDATDPREEELADEVLDAVHGGYASYGDGPCTRNSGGAAVARAD